MQVRVPVRFTSTGRFIMEGEASVDVDAPVNWDEVEAKCHRQEFATFYPTSNIPTEQQWDFDLQHDELNDVNDNDAESPLDVA